MEVRYFDDESNVNAYEFINQLADDSDNRDLIISFLGYCDEVHPDCFMTIEEQTLTFTWCRLESNKIKGDKDICSVDFKAKTAKLTPSKDNFVNEEISSKKQLSLKFSDNLINAVIEIGKNWKSKDGKSMPLPKAPAQKKTKIPNKLPQITVERNDSIKPDIGKFYDYFIFNEFERATSIKNNQVIIRMDSEGDKFIMTFDTEKDAIIALSKFALKRVLIDNDSNDNQCNQKLSIDDLKQLVYLYEKEKQGGNADSYTFSVYDPSSHSRALYDAIVKGDNEFVQQCIDCGADPMDAIKTKKRWSTYPMVVAMEADKPEVLKLLIANAHNYDTDLGVKEVKMSFLTRIACHFDELRDKIPMLFECGYDCSKDTKSLEIYMDEFRVSPAIKKLIQQKIKESKS